MDSAKIEGRLEGLEGLNEVCRRIVRGSTEDWKDWVRFVGGLCEDCDDFVEGLCENDGRIVGASWDDWGRIVGWEDCGRIVEGLWEDYGRILAGL